MTVVGLPRGGVPVAFQVAGRLHVRLDITVVRKVGLPGQPEVAMGAVAGGGVRILHRALIRSIGLSNYFVYALVEKEEQELERRDTIAFTELGRCAAATRAVSHRIATSDKQNDFAEWVAGDLEQLFTRGDQLRTDGQYRLGERA